MRKEKKKVDRSIIVSPWHSILSNNNTSWSENGWQNSTISTNAPNNNHKYAKKLPLWKRVIQGKCNHL
jgi:hypothetical protein